MESDKTNSDAVRTEMELALDKSRDLFPTLPKQESGQHWTTLYQYQGFWYFAPAIEKIVSLHVPDGGGGGGDNKSSFRALPTDIIIAGAHKSGNTWLKSLCFSIATRHQFPQINKSSPLLHHSPHDLVPFLELDLSAAGGRHPHHTLLSTHLPYTSLPESVLSSGCKIIHICREPKDVFVSNFYYVQKLRKEETTAAITDADVDLFCRGISPWGPHWDHVLGYYKASLENPDKILFLKYEDLKRDTLFYVKKLAEFIGMPFSGEEERRGLPENIVQLCSFGNLSGLEVNKTGKHRTVADNSSFFRKGETGDWKNHLSIEMAEKIDRTTMEKLKGYDFRFDSSDRT